MAEEPHAEGLLSGVRVLDLADEKGLACTKFLADLGADVIKIERPGGDPTRARPPFARDIPHPERSLYFLHFNANKRGITLDLETPDGQALFRQLARTADVVVETSRPGAMSAWGLDYEALSALNPRLIVASITWFGQTGPYRDYEGDELVAFALGGAMALSGEPSGPPIVAPGELACGMASIQTALAIEIALFHRLRTGCGQCIDVSVSEAAAHVGGYVVPFYSHWHEKPVRVGYSQNSFEFHDVYQCQDGGVRFFINPMEHWRVFLEWLGSPEELCDPIFDDREIRKENRDLINPYVEQLCQRYTQRDIYLEGQGRHLPVSPMNTAGDFVEAEQTKVRGVFVEVDHPVVGRYRQAGALHKYTGAPTPVRRPAPLVGQHNEEVLVGELGLTHEDLASLRVAEVI